MVEDTQALARRCAETLWAEDEAARHLGMAIDAAGVGTATISMTVTQAMVNGYGVCHGGFIFTLANTALSIASQSRNRRSVPQNCQIAFLAPGRLGATLVADARERHTAQRNGIWDVTVRTATGEAIAEFRGHARYGGGDIVTG
jgi:acyl-CoA thioesterase